MLKPQGCILQEILLSPLTVLFNPMVTPLGDPVPQREERQSPVRPTGQDPCLRLFPGDDFIGILAIFFKALIEFVQLLLSQGNLVGTGRLLSSQSLTAKANLSARESFYSSGIASLIMWIRIL